VSRFVANDRAFVELVTPAGIVGRGVARAAGRTRDRAKRKAPVDFGGLRQSIRSDQLRQTTTSISYRVSTNVFYARYQEEGTGIYGPKGRPILPRRAKVLRFIPKSKRSTAIPFSPFVFAKSVKGSKARHYMRDALRELRSSDFT
jgi:HK97 gp10 family phage protein